MQLDITFDVIHTESPIFVSKSVRRNARMTGVNRLNNPYYSGDTLSPLFMTRGANKPNNNQDSTVANSATEPNTALDENKVLQEETEQTKESFANLIKYLSTGPQPGQEDETIVLGN